MKEPKYYVAVFGDPKPPERDTVESGKYHLGGRGTGIAGERGDILLLYCTDSYAEHSLSVPGIGIVLTKFSDYLFYRYLPLSTPVGKDRIDTIFTEEDKRNFSNVRSDGFRMFEISRQSFRDTLESVSVAWP